MPLVAGVDSSTQACKVVVRDAETGALVREGRAAHPEGTACVVGDPTFAATSRVRSLSPELVKGLEFDLVVLVEQLLQCLRDDEPGQHLRRVVRG